MTKTKTEERIVLFLREIANVSEQPSSEGKYVDAEIVIQKYRNDFQSGRFVALTPALYYTARRDGQWASIPGGARFQQSCFSCAERIAKFADVYDLRPDLAPTFRICAECRLVPPRVSRVAGWDHYVPVDRAAEDVIAVTQRPLGKHHGTDIRKDAAVAVAQLHDMLNVDERYSILASDASLVVPKNRLRLVGSNIRQRPCSECGEQVKKGEPLWVPINPEAQHKSLCEACFTNITITSTVAAS